MEQSICQTNNPGVRHGDNIGIQDVGNRRDTNYTKIKATPFKLETGMALSFYFKLNSKELLGEKLTFPS